ncbi:uncharacterized protein LOC106646140 [Copidosoma floridanum]|uniref:uncharacterized protein LOC106646140 n=1 Tax=Copidosoma floridanum TaxID=29053 RepID=UPI0006C9DAFB|nr:uncharacterized protein LOC106646140 [Copidosoma floridanum]
MKVEVKKLYKVDRHNYLLQKLDLCDFDETCQANFVEIIPFACKYNSNRYLLTVINVFSKFVWAVPVKNRTCKDVNAAMKSILTDKEVSTDFVADRGKQFYSANYGSLMQRYKINLFFTYSYLKASLLRVAPTSPPTNYQEDYQEHLISGASYEQSLQ